MGSISFGSAFVAGSDRVPKPATGKIALVTDIFYNPLRSSLRRAFDFGMGCRQGMPATALKVPRSAWIS
jgi:hypothetical protein